MHTNRPTYQLTRFPVGSTREVWGVSWPLIIGLLSASLMLFIDRLFLSRYSIESLNAATSSGTAAYSVILLFMGIAAISEVFVGRFHGEDRKKELGKPVWQMIWFSLLTIPFFLAAKMILPSFLFQGSPLFEEETAYFSILMISSPLFCLNVALAGFFVGSGQMRIVTFFCLLANLLNIVFDVILIFGMGPVPALGIKGAAIATGIAEGINILCLFSLFLKGENRKKYGTSIKSLEPCLFFQCISVGFPAAALLTIEVAGNFGFYKIISTAGDLDWTVSSMMQGFYFLSMFLFDGLSRGVSAVSANLLGARKFDYIPKVIKSAVLIQIAFFIFLFLVVLFFSNSLVEIFFNDADELLLKNSEFMKKTYNCFFFMSLFFLFFGLSRIITGHLIAALDTKFLLRTGSLLVLGAYLVPVYVVVSVFNWGVEGAYLALSAYSVICLATYLIRYKSKFPVR